jgi:hypothetical protein
MNCYGMFRAHLIDSELQRCRASIYRGNTGNHRKLLGIEKSLACISNQHQGCNSEEYDHGVITDPNRRPRPSSSLVYRYLKFVSKQKKDISRDNVVLANKKMPKCSILGTTLAGLRKCHFCCEENA